MAADPDQRPGDLRRFASFLAIVVVATFVFTAGAFLALRPGAEAPLRVLEVSLEPAVPVANRVITVLARTEGGSGLWPASAWLFLASSYRNEMAQSVRMTSEGGGTFSAAIGPFVNGAELWLVVAATTAGQGPVFSQHLILPVGTVIKDSANLTVDNVFHSPPSPWPQTPVTVFAQVRDTDNATRVSLTFGWFGRGTTGAGNQFMWTPDGVRYQAAMDTIGFGRTIPAGTQFFYRVAAIDANGVTADSGILSFGIDAP